MSEANVNQLKKSVTDYLNMLAWDGTPRLDRWLVDCAGAENSPYVRAASRAMLVAAVRRARHPGCKFDQMPVIEGPQGCCKSSALRLLAVDGAWFTDDLPITSTDVRRIIEATAGKWIVEVSELQSLLEGDDDEGEGETAAPRRKPNALKAFLSRSHDEARMAYRRERSRVPRGFVFFGTTAATDYLQDPGGNRHICPVGVQHFDLANLAKVRDHLWAEASVVEAAGESIDLAPSM